MNKKECIKCGKCCRFMAVAFDKKPPQDWIRWFNFHEKAKVIKTKEGWSIRLELKCSKLKNNRCSIYKNRPQLCKEYKCWEAGFPKP